MDEIEEGEMRRKSLRTREKALEIPKLAKVILSVHRMVTVFFSHLKNLEALKTHQQELTRKLFYIEQNLCGQLGKLPSLISQHITQIYTERTKGK